MDSRREFRIREELAHRAAEFFARTANRDALITITFAQTSSNLRRATIYFTVYPEEREEAALAFVKRQRNDFREYLKKAVKLRRIPLIDFKIDEGDKNRRRIDELSKE